MKSSYYFLGGKTMNRQIHEYKNEVKNFLEISPYYFQQIKQLSIELNISTERLEEKFLEFKNTKEYRLYSMPFKNYYRGERK